MHHSRPLSVILKQLLAFSTKNRFYLGDIRLMRQRVIAAVAHGEFATAGFRNRDLHALLQPQTPGRPPGSLSRPASLFTGHALSLLRSLISGALHTSESGGVNAAAALPALCTACSSRATVSPYDGSGRRRVMNSRKESASLAKKEDTPPPMLTQPSTICRRCSSGQGR